jgi:hypothetical protein
MGQRLGQLLKAGDHRSECPNLPLIYSNSAKINRYMAYTSLSTDEIQVWIQPTSLEKIHRYSPIAPPGCYSR